jgi:anti-sigma factor RsiW
MSCAEFAESFDAYVDEMLEPASAEAATRHIAMCTCCDREVARWQQTRILLSTAVADLSTAVDVSALRRDVEAALGFSSPGAEPARVRGGEREATRLRGIDGSRKAGRQAATGRRQALVAAGRFLSAASVSAAIAAGAVLMLTPTPVQNGSLLASVTAPSRSSSFFQPASYRPNGRIGRGADVAPAAYTPPPLARPEASHVDGLEAAPGRTASTWVQPRTNARVIWVADRGAGAPIRTAGLDR